MTDRIRLAPGNKAIPGFYRECENSICHRLIPTPFVKCQEHRTDYKINDYVVPHYEPNEVEIITS